MKKLITVSLAIMIMLCTFGISYADGLYGCYKMMFDASLYNALSPGAFDYEMESVDIYLADDFKTIYYQRNKWFEDSFESTGLIRGSTEKTGSYWTATFKNGFSFKYYFEGNDDEILWMNMNGGSFKLHLCDLFFINSDLKTEELK